jgi:hypothetical protein
MSPSPLEYIRHILDETAYLSAGFRDTQLLSDALGQSAPPAGAPARSSDRPVTSAERIDRFRPVRPRPQQGPVRHTTQARPAAAPACE